MEFTLGILAVLLLVALGLAVFVFTYSARSYVSECYCSPDERRPPRHPRYHVSRATADRRREAGHSFPCEINGLWVVKDRRSRRERRG
ncbi:hypothetical protein [Parahaliea mediterranea]|uniref:hypothetical protein n=1 Tax=Parahaliea mediterranea TaxID=651086 RepID=UPI001300AEE8|nr:hypothetical protein [Parahaliea mediterranea]